MFKSSIFEGFKNQNLNSLNIKENNMCMHDESPYMYT